MSVYRVKLASNTRNSARIAELENTTPTQDGFAVLSAVQVKLALLSSGITTAMVDAAISSIQDEYQRNVAKIYWDEATEFHRNHPMIQTFSSMLNMTEEQVDALWLAAAQIN